jgi:ubiquinone/menaquinone biosynthesis C-methylase UbiE
METIKISYKAKVAYQKMGVAQQYDELRFSNLLGRLVDRLEKDAILELIPNQVKTKLVIDIPCGTGRMTEMLANGDCYVVGVDVSKSMLLVAKGRLKENANVDLVLCDAEQLPFKDNVSNLILSARLMGHVPPFIRAKIIGEFSRVTKGRVIVAFYTPLSLMGVIKRIRRCVRKNLWFPVTHRSVRNEIKNSGLHIQKTRYILSCVAETYFILAEKV